MPLYNQTGMVWQTIGGTTLAAADIRILYYVITHTQYYYYIIIIILADTKVPSIVRLLCFSHHGIRAFS